MQEEEDVPQNITPQEERELVRTYNHLCHFLKRSKLEKEAAPKRARRQELIDKVQTSKKIHEIRQQQELEQNGSALAQQQIDELDSSYADLAPMGSVEMAQMQDDINQLTAEINGIESQIEALRSDPDKKIRAPDLMEALRFLGKKVTKKEVADMIWEVDENLDGCVDWEEYRLMFQRNIFDRTGLEPSKLYNMVQFMIYDHDNKGLVSVDQTMNMLYARYGRSRMEQKLRELFGTDMRENGKQGGEIDFLTYLQAVERTQMNTFLNTSLGKTTAAKTAKRLGGTEKQKM